jgi:hypothetical protein
LGFAKLLGAVRDDVVFPEHPEFPEIPRGMDDVTWCSYSAGGEGWWKPGGDGEEFGAGVVFVFAPFVGGGQVGVDDGEFGEAGHASAVIR